jgi:hypothetical protein
MEKFGDGQKKMEGHCSKGQSSQRAVVPLEEEEEDEEEEEEEVKADTREPSPKYLKNMVHGQRCANYCN